MDKKLEEHLKKYDIEYKIYEHPAVFTVEESKKLVKNVPGLHTKSLFLKDEKGNFYLVCMPAEKRLNMKSLRKIISKGKIHFASPEELKANLNLTPGSVSIFGMIYSNKVNLLIDREILDSELAGFHPNINTATLVLNHNNLEKFISSLKSKWEII